MRAIAALCVLVLATAFVPGATATETEDEEWASPKKLICIVGTEVYIPCEGYSAAQTNNSLTN